jgi:ribonuclease HII
MEGLDFAWEEKGWSEGLERIAGVDEAGRGPLAGPVVAAAVVFPKNSFLAGLNDSKKLTPRRREKLLEAICAMCDVGVGAVPPEGIDKINIFQASRLAMKIAVENLSCPPERIYVDGPLKLDCAAPQTAVIGGDARVASIAAASIVAKVLRDRLMLASHDQYPQYGFDRHKGYPSPGHIEAIRLHGLSPLHRKTFRPKALENPERRPGPEARRGNA